MIPARAGTKILASLAILFLLGFGFVVYAVPGAAGHRPLASASSPAAASTQGEKVSFRLVQVAAVANGSRNANASGYAGISISGQSLSVEWSIRGAMPGALLELDMQAVATDSTGTSKSFAIATAQVNPDGEVGSTGSATLDPGNYSIGLTVVDPSTNPHGTVFTSDPATAQVTVSSSQDNQTQPNRAIGSTMSYSLVPFPVYLGSQAPSNFSFREGGALVVVSGDQLQVTTSFLGAPNTEFVNVVQTTHQNITAGTVTTTSTGGGVFKGSVTLEPGTYDVGLLVYVFGNTASPVAVSDPRAIEVTLPVGTQTSSTSTNSESSSSASTSTTTSFSTSQSKTTSIPPPETVNGLTLAPVTASSAPHGYLYGKGSGGFAVTGGSIYFSLLFVGQNPNARYSLVLSVNGTARTIGNYTTNNEGSATTHASAPLGTGEFALSLSVVDLVSFNAPTVVLATVPASFTVVVHAPSTSTSTSTSTTTSSNETETQRGGYWTFKLTPVTTNIVPPGYRFATSGTAVVLLDAHHSLLNVVLGFQNGNPSTTYSAALVLNGTRVNLGSMTTNREGGAELHSSIQVNPGTYLVGVEVYDVSDVSEFNASGPVLVMTSDPNTQVAVIIPTTAESSSTSAENSGGSHSQTTTQSVGHEHSDQHRDDDKRRVGSRGAD